jgi:hypothetical protein
VADFGPRGDDYGQDFSPHQSSLPLLGVGFRGQGLDVSNFVCGHPADGGGKGFDGYESAFVRWASLAV